MFNMKLQNNCYCNVLRVLTENAKANANFIEGHVLAKTYNTA